MSAASVFVVGGMTCGGCVGRVKEAIEAVAGAESVVVTLEPPHAVVEGTAETAEVEAAVRGVGKSATLLQREESVFEVGGMTCGGCVGRVKEAIGGVTGVEKVTVTLEPPRAVVEGTATASEVEAAVKGVGKSATLLAGDGEGGDAIVSRESVFEVGGMTCGGCVGRVKEAIEGVYGVEKVTVTLEPPRAFVEGRAEAGDVEAAVRGVGKSATLALGDGAGKRECVFEVGGMTCGGCVGRVKEAIEGVEGVEKVVVTLEPPRAVVEGRAKAGDVEAAVRGVGKTAALLDGACKSASVVEERAFEVGGMTCGGCVGRVKEAIESVAGVEKVTVTLKPPRAIVIGRVAAAEVEAAVIGVGKTAILLDGKDAHVDRLAAFENVPLVAVALPVREEPLAVALPLQTTARGEAAAAYVTVILSISGMTCSSCVGIVEKLLGSCEGVLTAKVNLLAGRATVTLTSGEDQAAMLRSAVENGGYGCRIQDDGMRAPGGAGTVLRVFCGERRKAIEFRAMVRAGKVAGVEPGVENKNITVDGSPDVCVVQFGDIDVVSDVDPESIVRVVLRDGESVRGILKAVEDGGIGRVELAVGDGASGDDGSEEEEDECDVWKRRLVFAALFTAPLMLLNMFGSHTGISMGMLRRIMFALATPVQVVCGFQFYRGSYHAIRKGRATMDVLIALSTTIAYATSVFVLLFGSLGGGGHARGLGRTPMFNVSAMIITYVSFGKWLESLAKKRAAAGIVGLAALAPKDAVFIDEAAGGATRRSRVPIGALVVGDLVRVAPGEKVPLDSVVENGASAIDESMVTGESLPVVKEKGDFCYGGTKNGGGSGGSLLLRVTAIEEDATLAQIVKVVDESQTKRAPLEQYADKASAVFVPGVISLSAVTFCTWLFLASSGRIPADWFATDGAVAFALLFAIETLVIACPCALGLATPTAVMVASEVSTKLGILFQGGGAAMQATDHIKVVLFDKTGTLTMGTPAVVSTVVGSSGHSMPRHIVEKLVHTLTASSEKESRHPLADSIVNYIAEELPGLSADEQFSLDSHKELPGHGMEATLCDRNTPGQKYSIRIGSRPFALKGVDAKLFTDVELAAVDRLEGEDGLTVVAAVVNDQFVVVYALEDQVRPEASNVVAYLQDTLGLECGMVTGDSAEAAFAVGAKVGIDRSRIVSRALPLDKAANVKSYPDRTVCFVGDGINDAAALAAAGLGVAIGTGQQIATEAANVVLVRPDLRGVVNSIDIGRTSFRRVRLNFLLATIYNLCGIPIAAGVFYPWTQIRIPPSVASLAMALSSTAVVLSSVALRRYCAPKLVDSFGGSLLSRSSSRDSESVGSLRSPGQAHVKKRDGMGGPSYVLMEDNDGDDILTPNAVSRRESFANMTFPDKETTDRLVDIGFV